MSQTPANETAVPLADVLANRWSSRSFDAAHALSGEDVVALGEAARWAPSARNRQPRRFIVARRGTPTFQTIVSTLLPSNQLWAPRAGLFVVALAETSRDGAPVPWSEYDLGQAVAHLTVEAAHRGLNVRQMGGFDRGALRAAFALPAELLPVTVVAVGKHNPSEALPDEVREREAAPRQRRTLDEMAYLLDI